MSESELKPGWSGWKDAALVYTRPRVVTMIFLGFSAGLPFLLVFSTLSAWLRDVGIDLATIGFFSWIGITYSVKVFWAPVVDHLRLPFLTNRLGKRRSWMLLAQLFVVAGILAMSFTSPTQQIILIATFALIVAFGSATQDICIDAYRIEAVEVKYQGAMAAAYVFGYRVALLFAGAGAFYIAEAYGWMQAYICMAAGMCVGVVTTLIISEPAASNHGNNAENTQPGLKTHSEKIKRWFIHAVIDPFVDFFQRNGKYGITILLLIGAYKLSEITMGAMANPFYIDLGFSKKEIADITKVFGFFMTIFGAALGGIFVTRYGLHKPLLGGCVLIILTNLLFVLLAITEPNLVTLALVVSADNLSGGFATSAFIAYLSSLTNRAYTATQYALFSSLMTLPAKFISGFSGIVAGSAGYALFFLYAAALGVPALLLIIYLFNNSAGQEEKGIKVQ